MIDELKYGCFSFDPRTSIENFPTERLGEGEREKERKRGREGERESYFLRENFSE